MNRIRTTALLLLMLALFSGCSKSSGPGTLRYQLDELAQISGALSTSQSQIELEYREAADDLELLKEEHDVITPTDRPRIRKLLLECFSVPVSEESADEPCQTLSSYTLDKLKAERPPEFAVVVDEQLHRTARLRDRLKSSIPAKAEAMAAQYVEYRARVAELRSIAETTHGAAQAYDPEDIVEINRDYATILDELKRIEATMKEMERELNETPPRLRELLTEALKAITQTEKTQHFP